MVGEVQLWKKKTSISSTNAVTHVWERVNSLQNDNILVQTKLNASADNKINLHENFNLFLGRVKNIDGKGESAGYQHFLLPHNVFKRFLTQGSLKS